MGFTLRHTRTLALHRTRSQRISLAMLGADIVILAPIHAWFSFAAAGYDSILWGTLFVVSKTCPCFHLTPENADCGGRSGDSLAVLSWGGGDTASIWVDRREREGRLRGSIWVDRRGHEGRLRGSIWVDGRGCEGRLRGLIWVDRRGREAEGRLRG